MRMSLKGEMFGAAGSSNFSFYYIININLLCVQKRSFSMGALYHTLSFR